MKRISGLHSIPDKALQKICFDWIDWRWYAVDQKSIYPEVFWFNWSLNCFMHTSYEDSIQLTLAICLIFFIKNLNCNEYN